MRPAAADTRSLIGITLGLVLTVISTEAITAETCGVRPSTSGGAGSTFVLLIGYPRATTEPDLPELSAVGDDVLRMMQFFEPLRPHAVRVHLERSPRSDARLGERARPPTLAAIERSVDDLIAEMRTAPEPRRIYVYYAGHGQQGWSSGRPRTRLFLAPDESSDGAGSDGALESNLLANRILAPLGRYGTVHFIADACQSWFLLEVRGVTRRVRVHKRRPVDAPQMARAFSRQLPSVGALLATNGTQVTYEDPSLGGLFSHALRSAALGPGDLNGDGRITYRELDYGIEWILGGRAGSTTPGLHPPGGADDAVFIDWTTAPDAAPVCFEQGQGRYQLLSEDYGPLATIHAGERPVNAWLTAGQDVFAFGRRKPADANDWWTITVAATTFSSARRSPTAPPLERRGTRFRGLFALPLDQVPGSVGVEPPTPREPSTPRTYLGLGAQVGLDLPLVGAPGVAFHPSAIIGLRLGRGADQLLFEPSWTSWDGVTTTSTEGGRNGSEATADQPYTLHFIGARAGYARVVSEGAVDLAMTGSVGGAVALKRTVDQSPLSQTGALTARLGAMMHWPMPAGSPFAVRLDLAATYHGLIVDRRRTWDSPYRPGIDSAVSLGVSIGLDWEEPL